MLGGFLFMVLIDLESQCADTPCQSVRFEPL